MKTFLSTLRNIVRHPLNSGTRVRALIRYVKWQIGGRLVPGPVVVPFVNDTSLIVSRGMTGATQHLYTGLADFAECSLLLHLLRKDQIFVDAGANVGVYTVLASGAVGAQTVSIEPVSRTFHKLCANLRINNIADKVAAHNIGLGREESVLRFTTDRDTMNRVIKDENWTGPSAEVRVSTLDRVLDGRTPTLIKLDVEGWESEVLAGATATLACRTLLAMIVEMNSSDAAFSANELAVHECLLSLGFMPYAYEPLARKLIPLKSKNLNAVNTIYLRDIDKVAALIDSAPRFRANGKSC